MTSPYTVTINDGAVPILHFNNTIHDNGTHTWIYFAYGHSTLQIDIIPEFNLLNVLPILMGITLLIAIIRRKRNHPAS